MIVDEDWMAYVWGKLAAYDFTLKPTNYVNPGADLGQVKNDARCTP